MTVGDLAEFRARDVDRDSIPAEAFFVALDAATGRRRRLLEPDADARLDDDGVVRHDRGAAGVARPRRWPWPSSAPPSAGPSVAA